MLLEATLEQYLHESIPLSKAMGIRVEHASSDRVLLWCPLEPNINHRGTGFGGSIASIATLTAWSWLWVLFKQRGITVKGQMPKLVIRKSSVDYAAPVEDDFSAELRPPSESEIGYFLDSFQRRNSGRIELKVEVLCLGEEVAHFEGVFVAIGS